MLQPCRVLRFYCTTRKTTGFLLLSSGQRVTLLLYLIKINFMLFFFVTRVHYANIINPSADIYLQFKET